MQEQKHVLIVEDDPFYSQIYQKKLMKEQIALEIANNGDAALKAVKARRPGLILLDLIMPEIDGFETLAQLKAGAATRDIPVIVLSNLSNEEDIKRIIDLGAAEYFVKANVPMQTVIAKMKYHLGRQD